MSQRVVPPHFIPDPLNPLTPTGAIENEMKMIDLTKEARSRAHVAFLSALAPDTPTPAQRAYAECVTCTDWPDESLVLARAVEGYVDLHRTGETQFVAVDASALESPSLALRMCGFRRMNCGKWTDAPVDHHGPKQLITLPGDLLAGWFD